jgi:hypothetical protein
MSLTFSHLLEMPRKLSYGEALYMNVQHTMYLYFAIVGAPAEMGAVLSLILLCVLVRRRGATFFLTLTATICVAAGLIVWFAVVAPANREMAHWTTVPLPNNWESTRRHWEFGHSVSAILDPIGFGALIASVLCETDGMATHVTEIEKT